MTITQIQLEDPAHTSLDWSTLELMSRSVYWFCQRYFTVASFDMRGEGDSSRIFSESYNQFNSKKSPTRRQIILLAFDEVAQPVCFKIGKTPFLLIADDRRESSFWIQPCNYMYFDTHSGSSGSLIKYQYVLHTLFLPKAKTNLASFFPAYKPPENLSLCSIHWPPI